MTPALLAILLLACALASTATAHEFWLAPSQYRAGAGDTLRLGAFVGTGFRGEARPYAARRALRFLAHGATPTDLAPGAADGALDWARLGAGDDQGMLVAWASDFVPIELDAAEFERYLALEGLETVSRARAAAGTGGDPGRERYRRACKTWIAGPKGGDEAKRRARLALGLPLEIVPREEPGRRGRLVLEVRADGRPLAGALVRAWRQPLARDTGAVPLDAAARDSTGAAAEGRTDSDGVVTLRLAGGPGEWLVSTVHMVPSQDRSIADWESTWASLTFAVPPR